MQILQIFTMQFSGQILNRFFTNIDGEHWIKHFSILFSPEYSMFLGWECNIFFLPKMIRQMLTYKLLSITVMWKISKWNTFYGMQEKWTCARAKLSVPDIGCSVASLAISMFETISQSFFWFHFNKFHSNSNIRNNANEPLCIPD